MRSFKDKDCPGWKRDAGTVGAKAQKHGEHGHMSDQPLRSSHRGPHSLKSGRQAPAGATPDIHVDPVWSELQTTNRPPIPICLTWEEGEQQGESVVCTGQEDTGQDKVYGVGHGSGGPTTSQSYYSSSHQSAEINGIFIHK